MAEELDKQVEKAVKAARLACDEIGVLVHQMTKTDVEDGLIIGAAYRLAVDAVTKLEGELDGLGLWTQGRDID